jgi:hypothetical protein
MYSCTPNTPHMLSTWNDSTFIIAEIWNECLRVVGSLVKSVIADNNNISSIFLKSILHNFTKTWVKKCILLKDMCC